MEALHDNRHLSYNHMIVMYNWNAHIQNSTIVKDGTSNVSSRTRITACTGKRDHQYRFGGADDNNCRFYRNEAVSDRAHPPWIVGKTMAYRDKKAIGQWTYTVADACTV